MKNKPQTILIVEDDRKIAALLSDYFKANGFLTVVLGRGDMVPDLVREAPPDLIILDIMLPGTDGITLCQKLRARWDIPIIMVSAKVEEDDVLTGLEMGADDYICKPFSPREVVARAKTVLRRSGRAPEPSQTTVGGICLDHTSREIRVNGQALSLTGNEYGILNLMMKSPGKVCSREELIQSVQGYTSGEYKRTIDTHIKNLRKKLASAQPRTKVILSVYGVGYKFISEHRFSSAQDEPSTSEVRSIHR